MASPVNALLCALIAAAFWTLLGLALARHLLPRALALGAAAVIGWAAHSAAMLPIYIWIGLSPVTVVASGALCILVSGFSLSSHAADSDGESTLGLPLWAFAAAALLALISAAAILPKFYGDAVQLADPIFDHSKSAFVDAIARLGVPPVNPVFGEAGGPKHLVYYYLWHFSAAEVALVAGTMGWEADIGLTWFTAFASLTLMMGVAVWVSKRTAAAIWILALGAAGSVWTTVYWIIGADTLKPILRQPIGMSGWLFQASWVPQHLMAASCALTTMLLLVRMTAQQSFTLTLALALVVVAGFESSTFVGGVTFAIAAVVAAPFLFAATDRARRWRFVGSLALAALLVAGLIAPFVLNQFSAVQARGGGTPIIIANYKVFGEFLPWGIRRALDLPGYWLIILPAELPAVFFAGVLALIWLLRGALPGAEKITLAALACLAGAGVVVSWLLVSTLGNNNDLGLRAIIPAAMVLMVSVAAAAAGMVKARPRAVILALALVGFIISLPNTAQIIHDNVAGRQRPDGRAFAQSPELWAAVRRYAAPAARVANNPQFLKNVTPWPLNVSWALLANRSSCFAEQDLALAFAPLPAPRRREIDAQFIRVFAGKGTQDDVHELATQYDCAVAVVVPSDGAWAVDPFATSSDFRLAEAREARWRMYLRR